MIKFACLCLALWTVFHWQGGVCAWFLPEQYPKRNKTKVGMVKGWSKSVLVSTEWPWAPLEQSFLFVFL
jgi:hypothetical protein